MEINMGKLTKQQQQMIIALAMFVIGGGYFYWNYMLSPTLTQIKERQARYQDLTAKIETAERQARRLPALQLEYATLQQELVSLEKQLPTDKDLPNIIRVLTRQALQENLQFLRMAPKPSIHQTYFEIIPFDLQFTGSLQAFARFLSALGQQDRIFQAQNVTLNVISGGDPQLGTLLNIALVIQTYAYTRGAK
jgi:type IV pilus assembly protein PilO